MKFIENIKLVDDETRIRIFHLLNYSPLLVHEICQIMNQSQANVSKHLKKLLVAEAISVLKLGQANCYYINRGFLKQYAYINNLIIDFSLEEVAKNDLKKLKKTTNENSIILREKLLDSYNENLYPENIKTIDVSCLDKIDLNYVIDIREKIEYDLDHIAGIKNISLSSILQDIEKFFNKNDTYYLLCQVHTRSFHLAKIMKDEGYNVIVVLRGMDGYINN